jgi:hypothetical protein
VEEALNENLLNFLLNQENLNINALRERIRKALETFDSEALAKAFEDILSWNTYSELKASEGQYQAIICSVLRALSFEVTQQSTESSGVMDAFIKFGKRICFICEFKFERFSSDAIKDENENKIKKNKLLDDLLTDAKNQIQLKQYDKKYYQNFDIVKKMAVAFVGRTNVKIEIY